MQRAIKAFSVIIIIILLSSGAVYLNRFFRIELFRLNRSSITPSAKTEGIVGSEQDEANVIITFASDETTQAFYQPLIEDFQKQNPTIDVQFVPLDEINQENPDFWRELASIADTTIVARPASIGVEASKIFRDLEPLIDIDKTFQSDDFWSDVLAACQDNEGHTLGIPLGVNITGIFFDKEAFDTSRLIYPVPGWTFNDFIQSVTKLADTKANSSRYEFVDDSRLENFLLGALIEDNLKQTGGKIDTPSLAKDLQWYISLVNSNLIYPIQGVFDSQQESEQRLSLFASDRPALWVGSIDSAMPGGVGKAISQFGFAPFPAPDDGSISNTTPASVQCASMSAGTSHPSAAWKWLSFLSRNWESPRDKSTFSQIPARRSVTELVGFWDTLPEDISPVVRFGLEHAWFGSSYPRAYQAVIGALTKALVSKKDFSLSLNEAQAALPEQATPGTDNGTIIVATPKPTSPPNKTTIHYYGLGGNYYRVLNGLAKEFNQDHPEIEVLISLDLEGISPSPGQDPFTLAAKQNDCFAFNTLNHPDIRNSVISLNPLLAKEESYFVDDFYQSFLDASRIDGELYSLPVNSQPKVMYYNADLLLRRGIELPENDWTFDDFIQLATMASSQLKSDESFGFYYGANSELLFLAGRNVFAFDPLLNTYQVSFDQPQLAEALDWLADLAKSGVLIVETPDNSETIQQIVKSGRVAFWVSEAENPYFFQQLEQASFKVGVAPLPVTPSENTLSGSNSSLSNYIAKQAEDVQACWEWIKFLSSQPNLFPGIPARRSLAESPEWEMRVGTQAAAVYRQTIERTIFNDLSINPLSSPLYNLQRQAIATVFKGKNPQLTLVETQQKAERYLSCISSEDISKLSQDKQWAKINDCAKQADPAGDGP